MADEQIPHGLAHDNWYGYVAKWIYENDVTWMEMTVSSPYWTGIAAWVVQGKGQRRLVRHKMADAMYQTEQRVMFKGQLFSAPMDWPSMIRQLQELETQEVVSLPVVGEVLAARVYLSISSGLVDLNKCIRQATVRRNIVVQLIRMKRDSGHVDYERVFMEDVQRKSQELADSDEPQIPNGLADFFDSDAEAEEVPFETDKAATPAERLRSARDLQKSLERARPQVLLC